MIYNKTDEVIAETFRQILNEYQIVLETSMKDSDFIFDSTTSLHYKGHKINLKRGGSYIDSPDLAQNKKTRQ